MPRDLVVRAMGGDHDAFTQLAAASIGRLFAVARLILRETEPAEDAVQEALIAAWRDLSRCAIPIVSRRGSIDSSCASAIARPVDLGASAGLRSR